jgi:hypothetical protein
MVKQQPCILHTIAWLPWALAFKNPLITGSFLALSILGGYLPLVIYFVYGYVFMCLWR